MKATFLPCVSSFGMLGIFVPHEPSASFKKESVQGSSIFIIFKQNYVLSDILKLIVNIALSRNINRLFPYREFECPWYMKLDTSLERTFQENVIPSK